MGVQYSFPPIAWGSGTGSAQGIGERSG